ncbi:cell division protein FtsQ/DivIB [Clostridium sp. AF32-12BH]|uniref:cell division protein FtsQ/DivIB n=1 Tax=Clostridium sp. AF32-12BH TaxID=2292006 RepID=UPI000E53248E|nr:cell division protein FtsQ/DivIB [Clostridium sp. AF32-12BH]RHP44941.1 cell division protein FtsQ [Clostridium sp. AF32-12BH]
MENGSGKKKVILLAALLLLLACMAAVCSIKIRDITVTGNEKYTEEQLVDLVFPDNVSRSTVFCYLREHFGKHEKIPFVEDYKLVLKGLTRAELIVYEKSVVGYVSYMSSYMYFDKDGIIVESSSQKLPGVPWINGLKFGHIVLYQKLPVESEWIFQEILNLTQILSIYELSVDKIQYNTLGEATLYMGDIEVILGSNDGLNGKIAELGDMLPQLEGRSGTLYLDNYDETKTNPMYTFKPKN